MERSTSRILTTHAGSLPRPRELTRLYALRAAGKDADAAEIARAGDQAVRAVVEKQRAAGIDIGNDGEQQRDSFFLYLRARLSGLGGRWDRPSRADVDRYPEFRRMFLEQHAARTEVSAFSGLPTAIGEVRYLDAGAIASECRHFKGVLAETPEHEPVYEAEVQRTLFGWTYRLLRDGGHVSVPGFRFHGSRADALEAATAAAREHREMMKPCRVKLDLDKS